MNCSTNRPKEEYGFSTENCLGMATTHHIAPERRTLHGHFSRDLPPVLTIESGDTVVFHTLDARWSQWDDPTQKFEPRHLPKTADTRFVGRLRFRVPFPA